VENSKNPARKNVPWILRVISENGKVDVLLFSTFYKTQMLIYGYKQIIGFKMSDKINIRTHRGNEKSGTQNAFHF
jgi:hypothetical protein